MPIDLHFSSLMMTEAVAPSVRKEEEAAVMVPWGLTKAGFSFASCSSDATRTPLSLVTYLSLMLLFTAISSSSKNPAACAFSALMCERRAKASWSARDTSNHAQRRSAEWPITSAVENSATAGGWGMKSAPVRPLKRPSFCCVVFILPTLMRRFLRGREYRMGKSDMSSTPPAMKMSACPVLIIPIPVAVATFAPMQARVTVWAGTERGRPAPMAASRATLEVNTSWIT
mmetsp:Transcript_52345/g.106726  ORF Transcript_52345/g.106726 Transcript_52345/m.106726 type:complete len:229 (-) Transcript_52345:296-982(-)